MDTQVQIGVPREITQEPQDCGHLPPWSQFCCREKWPTPLGEKDSFEGEKLNGKPQIATKPLVWKTLVGMRNVSCF